MLNERHQSFCKWNGFQRWSDDKGRTALVCPQCGCKEPGITKSIEKLKRTDGKLNPTPQTPPTQQIHRWATYKIILDRLSKIDM